MADDANNKDGKPAQGDKALGLLEKADDFQWMLQIVSLVLFVDTALMVSKGKNLFSYPWADLSWPNEISWLMASAIAYSLLVSTILPFLEGTVGSIVRSTYFRFLYEHMRDRSADKRSQNQVTPLELKEYADRNQSAYALAQYKAWDDLAKKRENEKSRLCRTAFRALAFLLGNLYLSKAGMASAIFEFAPLVRDETFALSILIAVGGLLLCCMDWWCTDWSRTRWITYAPLYDEIRRKREEQEKRRREHVE